MHLTIVSPTFYSIVVFLIEEDVAEEQKNKTPEKLDGSSDSENLKDDVVDQYQETEIFFTEVDGKSENIEFGKRTITR